MNPTPTVHCRNPFKQVNYFNFKANVDGIKASYTVSQSLQAGQLFQFDLYDFPTIVFYQVAIPSSRSIISIVSGNKKAFSLLSQSLQAGQLFQSDYFDIEKTKKGRVVAIPSSRSIISI